MQPARSLGGDEISVRPKQPLGGSHVRRKMRKQCQIHLEPAISTEIFARGNWQYDERGYQNALVPSYH